MAHRSVGHFLTVLNLLLIVLQGKQVIVFSFQLQQFLMVALLDNISILHYYLKIRYVACQYFIR